MSKIKIGDIFEINTEKGKAYLHYIYADKTTGDLVRVLDGLYVDRPTDLTQLVKSKEKFMTFFPLSAANKKGIVEIIGNYPVNGFPKPKYMRTPYNVRGTNLGWHIVDTDNWQRTLVNSLTPEQKKLSPWGISNDTLLIKRIVENWSLEDWG